MNHRPITESVQNHPGFLTRLYIETVLRSVAEQAKPKNNETVLDYGCSTKRLKKYLNPKCTYIGYDKKADYTETKSIEKINPDIVIASHVLEHLTKTELNWFLDYCERKKVQRLVIALPLENRLSSLLGWVAGTRFVNAIQHEQDWRTIMKQVGKRFENTKITTVLFLTIISTWKRPGFE